MWTTAKVGEYQLWYSCYDGQKVNISHSKIKLWSQNFMQDINNGKIPSKFDQITDSLLLTGINNSWPATNRFVLVASLYTSLLRWYLSS